MAPRSTARPTENVTESAALRYWREQEEAELPAPPLAPADERPRFPAGWWLAPALLASGLAWTAIFLAAFG